MKKQIESESLHSQQTPESTKLTGLPEWRDSLKSKSPNSAESSKLPGKLKPTKAPKTLKKAQEIIQWHPAFFADIQIELDAEAENLLFENEHQLSKKPMAIDVLIIKKISEKPVKKNIGRIFRKYNIIEYKSPTDYLSADDFYKVYGYACFYKADVGKIGEIPADELTITFVCGHYPREMLRQVNKDRGISAERIEDGIYYLTGDAIPMQLLVTAQLSPKSNLWLHSLTNTLENAALAQNLVENYQEHKEDERYQAVLDTIIRANREKFEEVRHMCDALMELFEEEFAEAEQRGETRGEAKGEARGLARLNRLIIALSEQGRESDIVRAAKDEQFQQKLLAEYNL